MNTLGNFSFLQHLEKKPAAAAKSFFFCVSFDICSIQILWSSNGNEFEFKFSGEVRVFHTKRK